MTKDDIIRMAGQAGLFTHKEVQPELQRFAALVAAAKEAEHKEAMRWDIHSCGPTCKRYACVATREAVAAEREACAMVCEDIDTEYEGEDVLATWCAAAIRARGQA